MNQQQIMQKILLLRADAAKFEEGFRSLQKDLGVALLQRGICAKEVLEILDYSEKNPERALKLLLKYYGEKEAGETLEKAVKTIYVGLLNRNMKAEEANGLLSSLKGKSIIPPNRAPSEN